MQKSTKNTKKNAKMRVFETRASHVYRNQVNYTRRLREVNPLARDGATSAPGELTPHQDRLGRLSAVIGGLKAEVQKRVKL